MVPSAPPAERGPTVVVGAMPLPSLGAEADVAAHMVGR
jgi:hypothetical protein